MTLQTLAAEADAAFAIEAARHPVLHELTVKLGKEEALLFWRLAWATGRGAGISAARQLWDNTEGTR